MQGRAALRVGQVAVVAAAAAAAHSAFLAVNWGVVKGWSLAGHDDADSYIMEGSAFNENAHVAQGARWPCLTACGCARPTHCLFPGATAHAYLR